MERYRKNDRFHALSFVDITDPSFDARAEGLDPILLNQRLHVRLPHGEIRTAIQACVEIWRRLPGYHWLAQVASNRLTYPLFLLAYRMFAKIRHHVPKRKGVCKTATCQTS